MCTWRAGYVFKWRDTIGRAPVEPVPAGVHYDLWQGPAPEHAFTRNRFHYNWHWFWDYGNGDMGNQGNPPDRRSALGVGRRLAHPCQRHRRARHVRRRPGNTQRAERDLRVRPGRQEAVHRVPRSGTGCRITRSGLGENGRSPNTVGAVFYGSKGYLTMSDEDHGTYQSFLGKEQAPGPSGQNIGKQLGQLHRCGAKQESIRSERSHRGRGDLDHSGASGEYLLPPGPLSALRRGELLVRGGWRSQRHVPAPVPDAVHRAGARVARGPGGGKTARTPVAPDPVPDRVCCRLSFARGLGGGAGRNRTAG